MNLSKFKKECERLFQCKTIDDNIEMLNLYSEFLFQSIKSLSNKKHKTQALAEATILKQMVFTKALSLKRIIEGISYDSKDGTGLNNIIDPTIIAVFIRNLFETVCLFHLIYIKPKNEEERLIHYNLWVISGLKYRQKFKELISTEANFKKLRIETKRIDELIKTISDTNLFSELTGKDQKKIFTKIKQKDYKLVFKDGFVEFLNWGDLPNIVGIKSEISIEIYNYLSQYAHPSNVSVFQFGSMFTGEKASSKELAKFNLRYVLILLSIFSADVIKLFPELIKVFEEMTLRDQVVIDFHNTFARTKEYSINRPWEKVAEHY